jgi:hypothetical protein
MGDSASRPPEGSQSSSRPEDLAIPTSQGSQNLDQNVRKGRRDAPSQPSTSQTPYAQGHQYAGAQYQNLQARPDSFNLTQLSTALPDSSYQNYAQLPQRYPSAAGPSGLAYPTHNTSPYAAQQAISPTNPQYQYQIPFQGAYIAGNPQPVAAMGNQFYHQGYVGRQQQHGAPYIIQPNQFPIHNPAYPGVQPPAQWAPRGSVSEETRAGLQQRPGGGQGVSDGVGKFKFHDCG